MVKIGEFIKNIPEQVENLEHREKIKWLKEQTPEVQLALGLMIQPVKPPKNGTIPVPEGELISTSKSNERDDFLLWKIKNPEGIKIGEITWSNIGLDPERKGYGTIGMSDIVGNFEAGEESPEDPLVLEMDVRTSLDQIASTMGFGEVNTRVETSAKATRKKLQKQGYEEVINHQGTTYLTKDLQKESS